MTAYPDKLTPTEKRTVELVALGFSNPEIASRTNRSRGTVANMVRSIILKLGARNRTHVAYIVGREHERRAA